MGFLFESFGSQILHTHKIKQRGAICIGKTSPTYMAMHWEGNEFEPKLMAWVVSDKVGRVI